MEAGDYLELAKICKASKVHKDLKRYMDLVADMTSVLSREAIQLLSYVYNRFVTAHMKAWRSVQEIEAKPDTDEETLASFIDYRKKLQKAIGEASDNIVRISTEKLDSLPTKVTKNATKEDAFTRASYYKMQADYLRYKIDVGLVPDSEVETVSSRIHTAYKKATQESTLLCYIDNQSLVLSIALNWSVFCYEILDSRTEAIAVLEAKHLPKLPLDDPRSSTVSLVSRPEQTEEEEEVENLFSAITDNLVQWKAEAESMKRYESPGVTPKTSICEVRCQKKSVDETKSDVTLTDSVVDMNQIKLELK